MNFERDPRRKQEIRLRPVADSVYRQVWGESIKIQRFERDEDKILDTRFAIDVIITLPGGQILTGQEKFLSYKYASYQSVTVEYYQDARTEEHGDWFKLAVQFYFTGYATQDESGFMPWIILNWPSVVLVTYKNQLPWQQNRNKDGRARASFKFCTMSRFPTSCVIASNLSGV